jgi:hypothetical protein
MSYLSRRLKTAIEILELEIKRDKESLKTKSYKEKLDYEPGDGVMLKLRLKNSIQEKKRLETRL